MHLQEMKFRWDRSKAEANLHKHNVDFTDAVGIFEDIYALTLREEAHPPNHDLLPQAKIFWGEY